MEFPTVLLHDLLQLSSSVEFDDNALGACLASLVEDLQAAIPSYRGLHLTIVDDGHPISLTSFLPLQDRDLISTSLRVPFAALGPGFDDGSGVVFYAATPGALVDLAADFGYALDTPVVTADSRARSADNTDGDGDGNLVQADDGHGPHPTNSDRQHSHHHRDGDGRYVDVQRDGDRRHAPSRSDKDRLTVLDADLPPPTTRSGLAGLEERSMIDRAIGVIIEQGHHPDSARATLRRHAEAAGVEAHIYAARLLRG